MSEMNDAGNLLKSRSHRVALPFAEKREAEWLSRVDRKKAFRLLMRMCIIIACLRLSLSPLAFIFPEQSHIIERSWRMLMIYESRAAINLL
jgi:hypothetical protein